MIRLCHQPPGFLFGSPHEFNNATSSRAPMPCQMMLSNLNKHRGLISFESLHDAISPGNRYSDEVAIPDDSISRVGNLPGSICRNRRAFRKSNVEDPVTSTLPFTIGDHALATRNMEAFGGRVPSMSSPSSSETPLIYGTQIVTCPKCHMEFEFRRTIVRTSMNVDLKVTF
jgi:hypothetical protein